MELKITDNDLKNALSEVILVQIGQDGRDLLIKEALRGLLEKRSAQYGQKSTSVVEEAFGAACSRLAFEVIDKLVANDPQVRAQIEDFAREAIAETMAGADRSKIIDAFNSAFAKAISGERY